MSLIHMNLKYFQATTYKNVNFNCHRLIPNFHTLRYLLKRNSVIFLSLKIMFSKKTQIANKTVPNYRNNLKYTCVLC